MNNGKYSSLHIGAGCELGWIARNTGGTIERIPVLIITADKTIDDDTIDFIVSNYYTTSIINVDEESIERVEA